MNKLSRLVSIIYRHGCRFFDCSLSPSGIGFGQQFFFIRIYEEPGISMQKLAQMGHFDKGTVTKAVKKLEEQGYLIREPDTEDKRIHHLYITEAGKKAIDKIYELRNHWNEILSDGMSSEEKEQAEKLLSKMADNAYSYMNDRKVK